jgi:hypothetical protein
MDGAFGPFGHRGWGPGFGHPGQQCPFAQQGQGPRFAQFGRGGPDGPRCLCIFLGPEGKGAPSKERIEALVKKFREQFQQKAKEGVAPGKGPHQGPPQGWKPPSAADVIKHFDKKKDGKLTKDEVPPPVWEHFNKIGAVKNGVVTKDSLEAARKKNPEKPGPGPKKDGPKK